MQAEAAASGTPEATPVEAAHETSSIPPMIAALLRPEAYWHPADHIEMRRLPERGMLPAMLSRQAVGPQLVRRIARQLAEFHAIAATGPGVDEYGSLDTVRANWDENFAQTARLVGRTISPSIHIRILGFVERFLADNRELLGRRVVGGRIRDGHGDLHAGSVCVEGRRVHLFDCLEFAPRFRCSDVAAEVAFLAMDLDHHGRADLAADFVDEYVRRSGDADLPRLLDFYKCYRAYVRGKVTGLRLDEPGLSPEDRSAIEADARVHCDLAWAYAGGLGGPAIIVTMGLPASGKTTLARGLARHLGLVHLSSDVVRKSLAGLRPPARRVGVFGRGIYGQSMTRRTYAALRRQTLRWLQRGSSVVVDATFGQVAERDAIRRVAARSGARLRVLVCQADEATIRRRLVARETDFLNASDARLDIWPALRAAYSAPEELRDDRQPAQERSGDVGSPDRELVDQITPYTAPQSAPLWKSSALVPKVRPKPALMIM